MYLIATFEPNMKMIVKVFDKEQLWIPFCDDNMDYQEYLAWVAEGNTAEEWTGN